VVVKRMMKMKMKMMMVVVVVVMMKMKMKMLHGRYETAMAWPMPRESSFRCCITLISV